MDDARIDQWNQSYLRGENLVFYPYEGLIRFMNRYVRKRLGVAKFHDILQPVCGPALRGLDFGCGIGAGVILMHEFGVEAVGVDISSVAIEIAREHAAVRGHNIPGSFQAIQPGRPLPFPDGHFDFFASCGAIDSMSFDTAREALLELARVTRQRGYFSVIAGDYRGFFGDEQVETAHEQGTIQSYYNYDKCLRLLEGTGFAVAACEMVTSETLGQPASRAGRYHLTLTRQR